MRIRLKSSNRRSREKQKGLDYTKIPWPRRFKMVKKTALLRNRQKIPRNSRERKG